jgi:Pyridoxamine 5'-phosphate oxidase
MSNGVELIRLQDTSYGSADRALHGSWPPESAMDAEELSSFLDAHRYCILATTTPKGRAQARPVGFTVFDGAFWFATVDGGRLLVAWEERHGSRADWASAWLELQPARLFSYAARRGPS